MQKYKLTQATYYYFNMLNSEEKELYKALLFAILNVKELVSINSKLSSSAVQKIVRYIVSDRPDIFWFNGKCTISSQGNVIVGITFDYLYQHSQVMQKISSITSSPFYNEINRLIEKQSNDFEKALIAYEYIIKQTDYEEKAVNSTDKYFDYAYGIDGVVLKKRAVCSGYAKTFQYFMSKHHVVCTLVTGQTERERHAWNLINLYGSYYYIDATWGDPIFSKQINNDPNYISYDYFCFTTEELKKSHNPILDEKMPVCVDTKYNYYKYFGMIEDEYSIKNVANHIVQAKKNGKKEAVIKYSTHTVYKNAVLNLFKKKEVFEALKSAHSLCSSINVNRIEYSTDDKTNIIKISL